MAAVNAGGDRICARHVSAALPSGQRESGLPCPVPGPGPCAPGECRALEAPLPPEGSAASHWEAGYLARLLHKHGGNRRAAAQELGVSERTIYRKIRRYGLE